MARWRDGLALMARQPNIAIKVSNYAAYGTDRSPEALKRTIMTCIDAFGPDRAMFASDFPVARLHATFDEVYGAFKAITADLSRSEQHALFFGTAQRTYRLDDLPSSAPGLTA